MASLAEEHVRGFARSCLRSGLLDEQQVYDEVVVAITGELPDVADPAALASSWLTQLHEELRQDAATWPEFTDYHLLQAAFAELETTDVAVLQGCEDHWAAKAVLDERADDPPRGIAWFTPPDVWHAIDEGMLEVNLWHSSSANVAPGDALLDDVVETLRRHGLEAHFDEGRIEVAAHWRRPPTMEP